MDHQEHRGQSGDVSIQRYMAVCCIRCYGCHYSTPGVRVTAKMWESSEEDTQSPTRAWRKNGLVEKNLRWVSENNFVCSPTYNLDFPSIPHFLVGTWTPFPLCLNRLWKRLKETKRNFFTFFCILHFSLSLSLSFKTCQDCLSNPTEEETEWLIDGLFSFDWLM